MLGELTVKIASQINPQIVFVDDDVLVVAAMQRILRRSAADWNMQFVGTGPEALELLRSGNFSFVVADMQIPAMSGEQLLTHVAEAMPGVARIVLSGPDDPDRGYLPFTVHQYVMKPCDPRSVVHRIGLVADLRCLLPDDVAEAATELRSLPIHPGTLQAVRRAGVDGGNATNELIRLAHQDLGMLVALWRQTHLMQLLDTAPLAPCTESVERLQAGHIRSGMANLPHVANHLAADAIDVANRAWRDELAYQLESPFALNDAWYYHVGNLAGLVLPETEAYDRSVLGAYLLALWAIDPRTYDPSVGRDDLLTACDADPLDPVSLSRQQID